VYLPPDTAAGSTTCSPMLNSPLHFFTHPRVQPLWRLGVGPALLYLLGFGLLTYPRLWQFRTHFFADAGDGSQNVWNIWWVNKALTQLGQLPWHTTYLHYPAGTSLLGQTLNPFNGLLGVALLPFLSLVETYNTIVIFSFVMGGLTAFWLTNTLTRAYWSSWVGGALFTFSQYHFMHAEGHLQLVALEWVPLFVLCWYLWLQEPTLGRALAASGVLLAVLLCDHYYFLYCVIAAIWMAGWRAATKRTWLFLLQPPYRGSLAGFVAVTLATTGVLVGALLWADRQDPLIGAHDAVANSLDLLAPFIPGGHWRFADLTKFYWGRLGDINEHSVYLGWSIIGLALYAAFGRRQAPDPRPALGQWYGMAIFFYLLALGPTWHLAGAPVWEHPTPYDIFQLVFPPLRLSGTPVRMMVMVSLSTVIVSAVGLHALFQALAPRWRRAAGLALSLLVGVELWPRPLPATALPIPPYVESLRALPAEGGVLDTSVPSPTALYYQTLHEKPLLDGYISRYPTTVFNAWQNKMSLLNGGDYLGLAQQYNLRYVVMPANVVPTDCQRSLRRVAGGADAQLFAVQPTPPTRSDALHLPLDKVFSSEHYAGSVDSYIPNASLQGWAMIPGVAAQQGQVFVLLADDTQQWQLPTCRMQRPDVSKYYQQTDGLYDGSGYRIYLKTFSLPASAYRIGIMVENAGQQAAAWTDYTYVAEGQVK
jgi:hypothetical protein